MHLAFQKFNTYMRFIPMTQGIMQSAILNYSEIWQAHTRFLLSRTLGMKVCNDVIVIQKLNTYINNFYTWHAVRK